MKKMTRAALAISALLLAAGSVQAQNESVKPGAEAHQPQPVPQSHTAPLAVEVHAGSAEHQPQKGEAHRPPQAKKEGEHHQPSSFEAGQHHQPGEEKGQHQPQHKNDGHKPMKHEAEKQDVKPGQPKPE